MDSAFYKSFMVGSLYSHGFSQTIEEDRKHFNLSCFCPQNVEAVGKRFLVAVDVSTSLSSIVPGTSVSTAVAAAAITMVR